MCRLGKPRCALGTLTDLHEEPGHAGATDDLNQTEEESAGVSAAAMADLWARHLEAVAIPHGPPGASYSPIGDMDGYDEDALRRRRQWNPFFKIMEGWVGPPHLPYQRDDYVTITAPSSPHCGRRGIVRGISSAKVQVQLGVDFYVSTIPSGVVGTWTFLQDPAAIEFRRSQACTDHYHFECICNECWADNLTDSEQLGADGEARHGEALPRGASVVIIDPSHPYLGHIGTVLKPHRDAVDVQLKFPGPRHRGSAPPDLTVAVRPYGVECLINFCDLCDDDDDVDVSDADIGEETVPARLHHDATACA